MNIHTMKCLGSPEGPINTARGETYLAHAIEPGTTTITQIWTSSPAVLALQPGEKFLVFSKETENRIYYSFAGTAQDFPEFFNEPVKKAAKPKPTDNEPNF